jgi:hypothetical protein
MVEVGRQKKNVIGRENETSRQVEGSVDRKIQTLVHPERELSTLGTCVVFLVSRCLSSVKLAPVLAILSNIVRIADTHLG